MEVLLALINNLVVPEVLTFIKNYRNQNGVWPTIQEVQAEVLKLHDVIEVEGRAFLNRDK